MTKKKKTTRQSCQDNEKTEASTVGMPVTRPPPYSPGRAVFPHPVPRWYSRPRCKALSSREHPPSLALRDTWPCYVYPIEALSALLPGETLPLPTAPIAPCERTAYGSLEKAVQRANVAVQTVVVIVAPEPGVQPLVACTPQQVPMLLNPFRHPPAGNLELLTRRAPFDARHATPIWHPGQRESQTREAPPPTGVATTEAEEVGRFWCDLAVAFLQPVG